MGRYYNGDIEGKFWFAVQSSDDADFFSIDSFTGEVILAINPDEITRNSYNFAVTATDAAGNSTDHTVYTADSIKRLYNYATNQPKLWNYEYEHYRHFREDKKVS